MAIYLVGDIQGCASEFDQLLDAVDFSPSRDTLYPLGDLVNRGPQSIAVLRTLIRFGDSARPILGNHDLHLLALVSGFARPKKDDSAYRDLCMLSPNEQTELLDWLRAQPLARHEHGVLMVHAGVLPHWDCAETLLWAQRLHARLQTPDWRDQIRPLWGNQPSQWQNDLSCEQALRLALNAIVRLRFCTPDGAMDFSNKSDTPSSGYLPWFDVPQRKTENTPMAFGHWASLGLLRRPKLAALDTGCVWGDQLSVLSFATSAQVCELDKGRLLQIPATSKPHRDDL